MIGNRDNVYSYVNLGMEHITGYARAGAVGRTQAPLKPVTHGSNYYGRLCQTILSSQMFRELFVRHNNGVRYRQVNAVAPVKKKAHKQLRIEKQLRDEETLHRQALIFENLTDAVMVIDQNRRIVDWNSACEKLFGYTKAEAIGNTTMLIQSQEEFEAYGRVVAEGIERHGRWTGERTLRRKDGSKVVCEAIRVTLWDRDGHVEGRVVINRDITERKQAEAALRAGEERLRLALCAGNMGIFDWDVVNNVFVWSEEHARLFGMKLEDFDGRYQTFARCIHAQDRARVQRAMETVRADHGRFQEEFRIVWRDGSVHWVSCQGQFFYDTAGNALRMSGVTMDIDTRKRSEEQLSYQAHYDALTGLPNRTLFSDRLQQAIIEADRRERLVGVMFLDLDHFKNINDTLGHKAGDELLKEVSRRLKNCLRQGDTVARHSGDEFSVALTDMVHVDDAARVAQKILAAFAQPFQIEQREIFITTSIGVTLYPFDDNTIGGLIKNADTAMYRAKEHGRNNYQFYAAEMTAQALERLTMESALRYALERNQMALHYQPLVEAHSGAVIGVEALLRWTHPTLGSVPPSKFIPLAEASGLIVPIGHWVLETACAQAAAWTRQGLPPFTLAVNVSARQFLENDLVGTVRHALESSGLDPRRLHIEITESTMMQFSDEVTSILRALCELGVDIAIDDFGTDYSSFKFLKRFRAHILKIDRSFVSTVADSPNDFAIVKAICAMADSLGMKVVAEGVETAAQAATLRALGCQFLQGFYFSIPLPPDEFSASLRAARVEAGNSDTSLSRATVH